MRCEFPVVVDARKTRSWLFQSSSPLLLLLSSKAIRLDTVAAATRGTIGTGRAEGFDTGAKALRRILKAALILEIKLLFLRLAPQIANPHFAYSLLNHVRDLLAC